MYPQRYDVIFTTLSSTFPALLNDRKAVAAIIEQNGRKLNPTDEFAG
jgi:hypothetical protein